MDCIVKKIFQFPLDVNLVQVYIKNLEDGKMDIRRNQSIEKSVRSLSEGLCSDDRGNRALCNLLRKGVKLPSTTLKILLSMIDEKEKGKETKHDREK